MRPARAHTGPRTARLALGLAVLLLSVVSGAGAQDDVDEAVRNAPVATGSGPLETSIVAETLHTELRSDGTPAREWLPATRLSAGEEVYYTVRVHNPGKVPVTSVVVTKRLPFGVRYLRGSAVGPACEVQLSADGGQTFAPASGGSKAQRRAPAAEYSHVRWILGRPLAPGATALLRFRATFS